MKAPEPTAAGRSRLDEEGSGYNLTVYALEDVCEWLDMRPSEVRAMDSQELAEVLDHDVRGWYSGPGRSFGHGSYAYVMRTRVIVRQRFGLDI